MEFLQGLKGVDVFNQKPCSKRVLYTRQNFDQIFRFFMFSHHFYNQGKHFSLLALVVKIMRKHSNTQKLMQKHENTRSLRGFLT